MKHESMSEAKETCFMFCAFHFAYTCTRLLFPMCVDACVMWKEASDQRESRSLLVAYRAAGVGGLWQGVRWWGRKMRRGKGLRHGKWKKRRREDAGGLTEEQGAAGF